MSPFAMWKEISRLNSVADDMALRGARGNVKVNVGEDVVVYLEPKADGAYSITAGDDILLVLKPNANVTLSMNGDEIDVDWPGIENQEDVTERVLVLGDGSAKIALNAGGDIRVTNNAEAGNSAEDFGNFAGMNFDWSGFGERISRQVEQATARAAKRAEEAARRVERHAERHARRWRGNVKVGRWNWETGPEGCPHASCASLGACGRGRAHGYSEDAGGEKDHCRTGRTIAQCFGRRQIMSSEERKKILQMVQDGKISAEQAASLMRALDADDPRIQPRQRWKSLKRRPAPAARESMLPSLKRSRRGRVALP